MHFFRLLMTSLPFAMVYKLRDRCQWNGPICLERHTFRSHVLATVSHKQVPSALFGVRLCCSHDSPSPSAMDHKQKHRSQFGIRCLWNALQFAVMKLDRVGRFLCLVVCCLLVRWLEDDGSLFLAFFVWLLVLLDGCLKAWMYDWFSYRRATAVSNIMMTISIGLIAQWSILSTCTYFNAFFLPALWQHSVQDRCICVLYTFHY